MNPQNAYALRNNMHTPNDNTNKSKKSLSRNGTRGTIQKNLGQRKPSFNNTSSKQKINTNSLKLLNAKRDAANTNQYKVKAHSTINGLDNQHSMIRNQQNTLQNSMNIGIYSSNNNPDISKTHFRPNSNNNYSSNNSHGQVKIGTMTNNFTSTNNNNGNSNPSTQKSLNGHMNHLTRGKFQSTQNINKQSIEFNSRNEHFKNNPEEMKKVLSDLRLPKLKYEQQLQQQQQQNQNQNQQQKQILMQQKLRNKDPLRNSTPSHPTSKKRIDNSSEAHSNQMLSYNSFHMKFNPQQQKQNNNDNNQQQHYENDKESPQSQQNTKYQFKNIQHSNNNLKNSQIYKKIQTQKYNSNNSNKEQNHQQQYQQVPHNNNNQNQQHQNQESNSPTATYKIRNGYQLNGASQRQEEQKKQQNSFVNSSVNNFINNNRKLLQGHNSPDMQKTNKMINSKRNYDNGQNENSTLNNTNHNNNSQNNNNNTFHNNYKVPGAYNQQKDLQQQKKKKLTAKTSIQDQPSNPIQNKSYSINSTHKNAQHNPSSKNQQQQIQQQQQMQQQSLDQILNIQNILASFGSKTQAGVNAKGPKQNQDSMITYPNFLNSESIHLFVALDGHGLHGQKVSTFVKKILPGRLEVSLLRDYTQLNDEKYVRNSLRIAFFQISKCLLESNIDCTFSGTTCVLVLIIGKQIYCANIGDSRAVLGYSNSQNQIVNKPLSRDHKPDDPSEQDRIIKSGGRVDTYHDIDGAPIGPARVWLSDRDLPGLAMARSFGDLVAVSAGVICDPEIMVHTYDQKTDKMIVMGSDGIWEFVENQEAIDIAQPYYQKQKPDIASIKIVNVSLNMWKQNDDVIDDITGIIVFFQDINNQNSDENNTSNINNNSNNNNHL